MKKSLIALVLSMAAGLCMAAVDANKASEADLGSVNGIGPAISSKIVAQRKSAPFKNWGDLIERVPGIGDKRAAQLSAKGLTVNGEPYKATGGAGATPVK